MPLFFSQIHSDLSSRSDRSAVPDAKRAELQRLFEGFNVEEYLR